MKSWLIYIGAFGAGALGYYVALRLGADIAFGGRLGAGTAFLWVAPPLAALALFALAFGLGHGRAMKAGYWLGGLALMALSSLLLMSLIFFGIATPAEAAIFAAVAVFVVGRLLTRGIAHG